MHIRGEESCLKRVDFIFLDRAVLSVSFFFANLIYIKGLSANSQYLLLEAYLLPCFLFAIMYFLSLGILMRGMATAVIKATGKTASDHAFCAINIYLLKTGRLFSMENILEALLKYENVRKKWKEYHTLKNDLHITIAGKPSWSTFLDKTPQLVNTLKGKTSIISPKRLIEDESKMHNKLKLYKRANPGIGKWWTCNGILNTSYKEWQDMEHGCIENCSLPLDMLTFFRMLYFVLKKSGVEL